MKRPSKRDMAYLRSAAANPTGQTFISPFTDVHQKCRRHGWLEPTSYQFVARITDKGRNAIKAIEEME